jgi:hypothetical protein
VQYNTHLLDHYLPDAHGVQIVSDAHLHARTTYRDGQSPTSDTAGT